MCVGNRSRDEATKCHYEMRPLVGSRHRSGQGGGVDRGFHSTFFSSRHPNTLNCEYKRYRGDRSNEVRAGKDYAWPEIEFASRFPTSLPPSAAAATPELKFVIENKGETTAFFGF